MTQQDTDDTDTFTLCIPNGDDRITEIDFPSMESLEAWLLTLWPDYQDQLYQLTGEITQTDQLWIEVDQYALALVYYHPETGELEIN